LLGANPPLTRKEKKWESIIYQKSLKTLKVLEYVSIVGKTSCIGLLHSMAGFYLIRKQANDINVNKWRIIWIIKK
tara:strand:+ start:238 stop:462 length:225 start_codon:yes stop_codon:yes gene_type:complete